MKFILQDPGNVCIEKGYYNLSYLKRITYLHRKMLYKIKFFEWDLLNIIARFQTNK